jgi:hypothetical protein
VSRIAVSLDGPEPNASWTCEECPANCQGVTVGADPDAVRAEATAHLEETGHRVLISLGTVETLYPLPDVEGAANA